MKRRTSDGFRLLGVFFLLGLESVSVVISALELEDLLRVFLRTADIYSYLFSRRSRKGISLASQTQKNVWLARLKGNCGGVCSVCSATWVAEEHRKFV